MSRPDVVSGLAGWFMAIIHYFAIGPWFAWPQALWRKLDLLLQDFQYRQAVIWLPMLLVTIVAILYRLIPHMAATEELNGLFDPWQKMESLRLAITAYGAETFATLKHHPKLAFFERYDVLGYLAVIALYMGGSTLVSTIFLAPAHVYLTKDGEQRDTHGSAEWGTVKEAIRHARIVEPKLRGGLMLGRFRRIGKKWDPRYRTPKHVLTCAPTGAGKGVGCVIPNLLDYPGSVFVLDIKGENWAVTRNQRRRMGQHAVALDPFKVTGKRRASINWLDSIDPNSPDAISEAASLVDTLIIPNQHGEKHWDEAAGNLLQGLILYAAGLPDPDRHIGTVRELLTDPPRLFSVLQDLSQDRHAANGLTARSAKTFLAKEERERSSVLSTAIRHTAFLDDPRIINTLMQTDVDFTELKKGKTSIYLVIPPDKLSAYARYVRAMLGLALKAQVKTQSQPPLATLFLLDELAQLGYFKPLEDAISLMRGYGVTFWLLVQDLSQLQGVYPRWKTFLANTSLQFFGTQDPMTTDYVSKMLGQATVGTATESRSENSRSLGETNYGKSEGVQWHGRSLMMADEVRRLGDHACLVFEQGMSPFLLSRLNYLSDPELQGRWEANPMHQRVA